MSEPQTDGSGGGEVPTHGPHDLVGRIRPTWEGAQRMGTRADPSLTSKVESRNGVTSIALSGYLDMSTVPLLTRDLEPVERDGTGSIVLDLRGLTFVDSSGLHALLRAHERSVLGGHDLFFVGASDQARRVFELTRTDFLLDQDGTAEVLGRLTGDGRGGAARDRAATKASDPDG